ncbi:MFS transporter [Companilactobacillus sp.]|uniref:MFS transporter n=1 Tax=Companilactobacillus sp. TaxID=2767905 RepID=UPI0025BCF9AC|nr:MFS transporter [Companilactobacillus sp.]MCH4008714.1 MFS transporter [Companilactobacillus sp.]MCH4051107.1 MFS transporter [Companilactobacillus sp.]MCH4076657.1 MFS transporter [Companilactobacillus sp.]MCH4125232.1 MFS transporter [Companilactobacillus sp.]MCH4131772.1 MFS transporter [Companilactobacillus sp.]
MKNKRSIYILVFSNFLICLGIGLVIPVTPFIKNEFHYTTSDMGVMTSLFALAQFIASPIVGRISDRIGRKPIIVAGLLTYAVSEVIFALATSLPLFNLSRLIGGLSAAMVVPTSMALASDLTTLKERAKVIGWLSAAFSGGLILGPGIGGMLANISYKTPFWFAAGIGLISVIFTQLLLHDAPQEALEEDAKKELSKKAGSYRSIMTAPLIILFTMILVSSFGLQGFESIYSIYVNQVFNFGIGTIALVLTLNGIISLILQVSLFNWLVVKIGEIRLISYCFLLSALAVVWILFAHGQVEVIIATLIIFSSFDLLRPAITTLLTKAGKANQQGLINGMNMSLTSIGNIVGPLMSGALMDWNPHSPYTVVAVILTLSFIFTFIVRRFPVIPTEDQAE